jgi:hypothetical protein
LIGDTQEFTSAVAINRSLGELYKLLARDEIAPRRAAVMAYTGSLLLRTLPSIEHELEVIEGPPELDFTDWPRGSHSRQGETIRVIPADIPRPKHASPATEGAAAYARHITQPLPGDEEKKSA